MNRTARSLCGVLTLAAGLGITGCGGETARSSASLSAGKEEPLGDSGLTGTIYGITRSKDGTRFHVRFHNPGPRGKNVYLAAMATPDGTEMPFHRSIASVIGCYPAWVEAGGSHTSEYSLRYSGDGPIRIGEFAVTDSTFRTCAELKEYVEAQRQR